MPREKVRKDPYYHFNMNFPKTRTCLMVILMMISLSLNFISILGEDEPGQTGLDTSKYEPSGSRAGSHIVFAEDFTAEWCVYCPSASENLKEVYNDGDYDFYFVCMITQNATRVTISEDAVARADELGISSYPTVEFDGGYVEVVGGQSDDSSYVNAIETCNDDREIPDIAIELSAEHQGNAKIGIDVDVKNNGGSSYSGTLRVYIVEIVSRYFDYDGNHYPFGFLEYALDEEISVSSSGTTSRSTTWDGAKYTDGLGNDFSDINPDNIIIYATIMNSESTPFRERNTQSSKQINLYLLDEATATYLTETPTIDNDEPEIEILSPADSEEVSGTVKIEAKVTDESSIIKVEYQLDNEAIWISMFDDEFNDFFRYWDTKYVPDGTHSITIRAFDSRNNLGFAFIDVIVKNDFEDPVIDFLEIKDGDEVKGTLTLKVEAIDDMSIKNVRYRIDSGSWNKLTSLGFNEYSTEIDTTELDEGEHDITIEAEDFSGKTKTESITIIINNKADVTETGPSTPGFEAAIFISAILIITTFLLLSRKRFY